MENPQGWSILTSSLAVSDLTQLEDVWDFLVRQELVPSVRTHPRFDETPPSRFRDFARIVEEELARGPITGPSAAARIAGRLTAEGIVLPESGRPDPGGIIATQRRDEDLRRYTYVLRFPQSGRFWTVRTFSPVKWGLFLDAMVVFLLCGWHWEFLDVDIWDLIILGAIIGGGAIRPNLRALGHVRDWLLMRRTGFELPREMVLTEWAITNIFHQSLWAGPRILDVEIADVEGLKPLRARLTKGERERIGSVPGVALRVGRHTYRIWADRFESWSFDSFVTRLEATLERNRAASSGRGPRDPQGQNV